MSKPLEVFCLILLLIVLSKCSSEYTKLPFYNSADWEPEWIESSDPAFTDVHQVMDFSFTNQNFEEVNNASFADKIYVADFFFTTCPGICPKMTKNMLSLQEEFLEDKDVKLLSHSVMPWVDTVAQLKRYAIEKGVVDAKWNMVTGDEEDIYHIARKSYFVEGKIGEKTADDEFLHTEKFILVDKKGRLRGVYNGTIKVDIQRLIEDIYILKKEI